MEFVPYLPSILSIALLVMVAVISPGPDFAIVVKNSLIYSRKTALLTALGVALGILVHVSYTLLGLGLLIANDPWLLSFVKYCGALYLLYIGYTGLKAKKTALVLGQVQPKPDISLLSAIRSGFLTNALNPKCMLFFISLFSIALPSSAPPFILITYALIIFIETLVWFSFIAFCLSGKRLREKFNAAGHWIERVTGSILILLGFRLFLME